jgi:hypothetical protein
MKNLAIALLLMTCLLGASTSSVAAPSPAKPLTGDAASIASAKALFAKYIKLERAFDPALGDLYAPNAQVIAFGVGGQKLSFDGGMMKEMLKTSMPAAKAKNDTVEYKNVSYLADGQFVTIKATRHSNLKNADTPYRLVVASRDGKNWYIVQEVATAGE